MYNTNEFTRDMNILNKALHDSIISEEATSIAKDFSEVALDSILKDGLLKEIPIIGTLISLGKILTSLKDRQTIKKIVIFLSKLKDIPIKDRKDFASHMDDNDQFSESTSEKVLLLLERIDETSKAEIIGNLFKLYILNIIDKNDFMRFANIVERAYYQDLLSLSTKSNYFKSPVDVTYHGYHVTGALMAFGLYDQIIENKPSVSARATGLLNSGITEPDLNWKLNPQGQLLANIMFYDMKDIDFIDYINDLKSDNS